MEQNIDNCNYYQGYNVPSNEETHEINNFGQTPLKIIHWSEEALGLYRGWNNS